MNYIERFFDGVHYVFNLNAATLSGAIDIIVIPQPDGTLKCTPFHVRFGKLQIISAHEKQVTITVNGVVASFQMKLGHAGEAFFVEQTDSPVPEFLATSPLTSPRSERRDQGTISKEVKTRNGRALLASTEELVTELQGKRKIVSVTTETTSSVTSSTNNQNLLTNGNGKAPQVAQPVPIPTQMTSLTDALEAIIIQQQQQQQQQHHNKSETTTPSNTRPSSPTESFHNSFQQSEMFLQDSPIGSPLEGSYLSHGLPSSTVSHQELNLRPDATVLNPSTPLRDNTDIGLEQEEGKWRLAWGWGGLPNIIRRPIPISSNTKAKPSPTSKTSPRTTATNTTTSTTTTTTTTPTTLSATNTVTAPATPSSSIAVVPDLERIPLDNAAPTFNQPFSPIASLSNNNGSNNNLAVNTVNNNTNNNNNNNSTPPVSIPKSDSSTTVAPVNSDYNTSWSRKILNLPLNFFKGAPQDANPILPVTNSPNHRRYSEADIISQSADLSTKRLSDLPLVREEPVIPNDNSTHTVRPLLPVTPKISNVDLVKAQSSIESDVESDSEAYYLNEDEKEEKSETDTDKDDNDGYLDAESGLFELDNELDEISEPGLRRNKKHAHNIARSHSPPHDTESIVYGDGESGLTSQYQWHNFSEEPIKQKIKTSTVISTTTTNSTTVSLNQNTNNNNNNNNNITETNIPTPSQITTSNSVNSTPIISPELSPQIDPVVPTTSPPPLELTNTIPFQTTIIVGDSDNDAEVLDRIPVTVTPRKMSRGSTSTQQITPLSPTDVANLQVEISLCGTQLMGLESPILLGSEAFKIFNQYKVSYDDLCNTPGLLSNPHLIVKVGEKLYPWIIGAPLVVSLIVFRRPLKSDALDTLEKQYALEKTKIRTTSGWRGWWWNSKNTNTNTTATSITPTKESENKKVEETKSIEKSSTNSIVTQHTTTPIVNNNTSLQISIPNTNNTNTTSTALVSNNTTNITTNNNGTTTITNNTSTTLTTNTSPERLKTPKMYSKKTLRPTSTQLSSLNLKPGPNTVVFSVSSNLQGTREVAASIYLWEPNSKIVISDIDGTITKSDVFGQVMPIIGRDWTHAGVAQLYSNIKQNGYHIVYLTSRAIGQAGMTRGFINSLKQSHVEQELGLGQMTNTTLSSFSLPEGPVMMSPNRLLTSFNREVIRRNPEEFKVACLKDIKGLFSENDSPFYAGFGNRPTDAFAYSAVGIHPGKIFIINPLGIITNANQTYKKSYQKLNAIVGEMFPPVHAQHPLIDEQFNSWNYWKTPLPQVFQPDF